MSEAKDYGEPWRLGLLCVNDRDGNLAFRTEGIPMRDVLRILSCVNSCSGMFDPSSEIARLRADVERKDEALKLAERTLAFIPDESIPKDMHAAVGLLKRKITAALADTANKQGEQTCDH